MPSPLDLLRVGKKHDGRRKLEDNERDRIRSLFNAGHSIRGIARQFPHVSRRLIQFVLFPERLKIVNFPGHYKKYYDKEKHRIAMRKHRSKKQQLYS